jgi:hypothetical protein
MFHRCGHEVIHLGVEGSNPECSKHVSVIPQDLWSSLYGHPGAAQYNTRTDGPFKAYHELYAKNLRDAISAREQRPWQAIICATWGGAQQTATKDLLQFVVESGIGYRDTWAKYRVFESYAWMHFHFGLEKRRASRARRVAVPVQPPHLDRRGVGPRPIRQRKVRRPQSIP